MIRFARQAGIGKVLRDSHEDENGFHVDTLLFTHREYSEAEGAKEFMWAVRMVEGELQIWNKTVLVDRTGETTYLVEVDQPKAHSLFMLRDDFDSHIEDPRA